LQHLDVINEMGGQPGRFNTTHWSVVLLAGQEPSSESAAALESLCRAYWQPIFFFARRKGHSEEDAKDMTQQFFFKLLECNGFVGLDPRKGRFRTFLLTAFTHFMFNEYDRARAEKRGGGRITISLDELSEENAGPAMATAETSAAALFDAGWARAVVKQALERLKSEMVAAGRQAQFDVLKGFLAAQGDGGEYAEAAQKLGVADASVSVLVHRMRARYRELVRAEVARTVTNPAELAGEMRHLFDVLNQ
jgi:RNA polymerase sigma-70 factor (ECF subfamily)